MKIRTIEDFARPQDIAALRGVMSQLITRFPQNGEILDLIKAEYRAGRPLPSVEKALPRVLKPATRRCRIRSPRRSAIIFGKRGCLNNHDINLACTATLKKSRNTVWTIAPHAEATIFAKARSRRCRCHRLDRRHHCHLG